MGSAHSKIQHHKCYKMNAKHDNVLPEEQKLSGILILLSKNKKALQRVNQNQCCQNISGNVDNHSNQYITTLPTQRLFLKCPLVKSRFSSEMALFSKKVSTNLLAVSSVSLPLSKVKESRRAAGARVQISFFIFQKIQRRAVVNSILTAAAGVSYRKYHTFSVF